MSLLFCSVDESAWYCIHTRWCRRVLPHVPSFYSYCESFHRGVPIFLSESVCLCFSRPSWSDKTIFMANNLPLLRIGKTANRIPSGARQTLNLCTGTLKVFFRAIEIELSGVTTPFPWRLAYNSCSEDVPRNPSRLLFTH